MNSKGDISAVQAIIIAVIVLILMLLFTGVISDYFSKSGSISACQTSITKASVLQSLTKGTISERLASLRCNNLPDVQIKSSDVTKGNGIDDNLVKAKLSDAMLSCWNTVGKGQWDPYDSYDGDQVYCMICSDVVFDDNFVKDATAKKYEVKDMLYWMATNTVPGYKATYFKTLYGYDPDTATINKLRGTEQPIDIAQQYSIVWKTDRESLSDLQAAGLFTGGFGLTVGGAVIGGGIEACATAGAIAGGILGLGVGAAPGAVVGGIACGAIGAAVGFFGSTWAIGKVIDSSKDVKLSSIYLVPKSQLGSDLVIGSGSKTVKKPFCTKLVNY